MLITDLADDHFPRVQPDDKVGFVLGLMEDYDIAHLPVITKDEKFAGIISKADLLDADESSKISLLEQHLIKAFITRNQHILIALKQFDVFNLSALPVLNDTHELVGIITQAKLINALNVYDGGNENGAIIMLEMEKHNYSFGEIVRLIETNDAYITQLNTSIEPSTGLLLVSIRINKKEISDIISTLQRYEYIIRYYQGDELFENELKENYDALMNYLNM
jgi:Mg/Co/Ni transporter MgtE